MTEKTITKDVQKGAGQTYEMEEGIKIDLPLLEVGLTQSYDLKIEAHSYISEDRSREIVSQSTLAVLQIDKYKCQVEAKSQIMRVDDKEYVIHDSTEFLNSLSYGGPGPGEGCRECFITELAGIGHQIGNLWVYFKEIWRGSDGIGIVVHEGNCKRGEVYVIKVPMAHRDVAMKLIETLSKLDHPNIAGLYGWPEDKDFVYIALEKGVCSLHDLISSPGTSGAELHPIVEDLNIKLCERGRKPSPPLLKLMRDIVAGLAHLHKRDIVHGDVKPQNVLIQKYIDDNSISAKLSDVPSLTKSTAGYGTSGWQAPELLLNKEQHKHAVDSFGFGCLLFFCITGGRHPFGEILDRDKNISDGKKDLSLLRILPEAEDLISRLLDPVPGHRPTTAEVYNHPLFWAPKARLDFLLAAHDRVKLERHDSDIITSLESKARDVLRGNWYRYLDEKLCEDINSGTYNYGSIRALLRVIRNKYNHYKEPPGTLQSVLGEGPLEFEGYFSSRFPKLVMEVYKALKEYCVEGGPLLEYYKQYPLKL